MDNKKDDGYFINKIINGNKGLTQQARSRLRGSGFDYRVRYRKEGYTGFAKFTSRIAIIHD